MSTIKLKIGVDITGALCQAITDAIYAINLEDIGEREASYTIEGVEVEYDEDSGLYEIIIRTEQDFKRATNDEQRDHIIEELNSFPLEVQFTGEPGEAGWWIEPQS